MAREALTYPSDLHVKLVGRNRFFDLFMVPIGLAKIGNAGGGAGSGAGSMRLISQLFRLLIQVSLGLLVRARVRARCLLAGVRIATRPALQV